MILGSLLAVLAADAAARPTKSPTTIEDLCFLLDVKGSVVHFASADGTKLVGATAGTGSTGVLIANSWEDGDNDQICNWVAQPRASIVGPLVAHGLRVLMFDYRRVGFSQKRPGAFGPDLLAAKQELRRLGAKKIVILTEGTGALTTMSEAAQLGADVRGFVSLGAGGYPTATATDARAGGPVDGKLVAATSKLPLLFIVMRHDTYSYPRTKAIYDAAAVRDKKLLVLPAADQADAELLGSQSRTRQALQALQAFIGKHTR